MAAGLQTSTMFPSDDSLLITRPVSCIPPQRITPLRGRVVVLMKHESRLDYRPSGLVIPATAWKSNQWYGYVIGVGKGVDTVRFGDVVYLSRWGGKNTTWMFHPVGRDCANSDYKYLCINAEDEDQQIEAQGDDFWAIIEPVDCVFKVTDFEGLLGLDGGLEKGTHPVSNRVLLNLDKNPEVSEGGIIDPGVSRWPVPSGKVIEVAPDIEGIAPGQHAWYEKDARMTEWESEGESYAMIVADHVLAVSG